MKQVPYQGAYSQRRRYSNASVNEFIDEYQQDPNKNRTKLTINFNGLCGTIVGDNLTITGNPPSKATVVVPIGATVSIFAKAYNGYHFVKWSGAPVHGYTSPNQSIKMTKSYEITAIFEADEPSDGEWGFNWQQHPIDNPPGDYPNPPGGDPGENPPGDDPPISGGENPPGGDPPISGGENPPGGDPGGNPPGGNPGGGFVETKVKPFVKQWWWAILIVGYIFYKEWKGGKQ